MLKQGSFSHLCRTPSEVPEAAYSNLRREIGGAIGQPINKIFPEFSRTFPELTTEMLAEWPTPILACKQVLGEWLVSLVLERQDLNLFFDLTIACEPLDGPDFEQSHRMLPPGWRELYRWFWSFAITEDSTRPRFWRNTPFSFAARLTLEEYRQRISGPKSAAKDIENKVDSNRLYCWLWTEAGDALLLDELHCDHKVYHVRLDNLSDIEALPDADGILDRYLAHVVAGRPLKSFDFRKHRPTQTNRRPTGDRPR